MENNGLSDFNVISTFIQIVETDSNKEKQQPLILNSRDHKKSKGIGKNKNQEQQRRKKSHQKSKSFKDKNKKRKGRQLTIQDIEEFKKLYKFNTNKDLMKRFDLSRHQLFKLKSQFTLEKDLTFLQKKIQNKHKVNENASSPSQKIEDEGNRIETSVYKSSLNQC